MTTIDMIGDEELETLLADPAYAGHPLRRALAQLWRDHGDRLRRLEKVTMRAGGRSGDDLDSVQRFELALRQLERAVRISDRALLHLRDMNLALHDAARLDALTGLPNQRLIADRLEEEGARADRRGHPIVVAWVDLDRFDELSNVWGSDLGNRVLVESSRSMAKALRKYDMCGRWNGEEFLLLLPETTVETAPVVLQRVLGNIRKLSIAAGREKVRLTASIGATQRASRESGTVALERAALALAQAKQQGRDRYVLN